MREILFKGKRIDNSEWVEGNLVFSLDADEEWKAIIIPIRNSYMFSSGNENEDLGFENWYRVDFKTVCQYTGMTDKNGVKIFEGNICNCVYDGILATRVIVWDEDELDFKGTNGKKNYNGNFHYLACCEEVEVIGNIFDNPELIKT